MLSSRRAGSRLSPNPPRSSVRVFVAVLLAALSLLGPVPHGAAQDDSAAFRDLATGSDFRLRVAAALALGKSKSPGARPALERALSDPHPAVRAAAAAGLGSIGLAAAVPALKAALARESTPSVQAQMESTIKRLSPASSSRAKFLVTLGRLDNKSGVCSPSISSTLRDATRARLAQVPGVEVIADGADVASASRSRNLPAFAVDGSLTQLAKRQSTDGVGYAARVEYLIKRVPDHALKGTMSGMAQALASPRDVRGANELAQLQIDALSAAVDSALKGASPALEAAAK
jgi:hypothetical protein